MKLFEKRLLAEGLRATEGESLTLFAGIKKNEEQSFESLLLERATQHEQSLDIEELFAHFNKVLSNTFRILSIFVFILGVLGVRNILFADLSVSVNFFWAFALFFIPNVLMLILWLLFYMQPQFLQNSSLARFSLVFVKQIEKYFNKQPSTDKNYQTLFLCYFNLHFGKHLGRYQLSKFTHLLWLCYFCGATLMSILMLATHQVDFIWQTSILSSDTFQSMTHWLAFLPQQLGLPVPSADQIQQGASTTNNILDAENRRLAWSSLLISSLFLYGVLPRLGLFLLMNQGLKNTKRNFRLDLSHAYYVRLRLLLKPNKTTLGITDPDNEVFASKNNDHLKYNVDKERRLGEDHYPIAIELSEQQYCFAQQHLQLQHSKFVSNLINACDLESQQRAVASLRANKSREVTLYVSSSRLPDRGLKRFIGNLSANKNKVFKLLLITEDSHQQQRDSDWFKLAADVGINLDNIIHIEVGEFNHG